MSSNISKILSHINPNLVSEIEANAIVKDIPKDTEILREGQYVKVIPIVMEGLIKVFTRHEDKELLLYYIKPKDSCIMSFAAGLRNQPSMVYAETEEDTVALLLPINKVDQWRNQFPDINKLFFEQYNLRYGELLETINQILFDRMDKRLLDHLKQKVEITGKNPIKISHRQIANELGTAREVISRVMKKIESEGKITQGSDGILIL